MGFELTVRGYFHPLSTTFIHFKKQKKLYLTEFVFRQFTLAPYLSQRSTISLVCVESFKMLAKL